MALTEGLETLQAATSAKAAFLEENEATEADIDGNLNDLEMNLAGARASVSDRVLNARLEDAQDDVATARANIDNVAGLTAAVATLEDAQEALEAATDTRTNAFADVVGARANFETRNADATVDYVGYEVSVDGELVIELNDSGTLVVTEAGAELSGINTLLSAHQALQAADADLASAEEAVVSAEGVINELDLTAVAVEAKEARDEAQADLQAHVRANGSTEALETQLADAQAALAESVADSEAVNTAQANVAAAQTALDTRVELEGAVETAQTALDAHVAEFGELAALKQDVDDAKAAVDARGELVSAVADAQAALDDRADLVQDVENAQTLVNQRDALAGTVAELEAAQDARSGLEGEVDTAAGLVGAGFTETAVADESAPTEAEIDAEVAALEGNVAGAQAAVEGDPLWDTDVDTTTQAHVDAVAGAQTAVDAFDDQSLTFTGAQTAESDFSGLVDAYETALGNYDTDTPATEAALVEAYDNLRAGFTLEAAPADVADSNPADADADAAAIVAAETATQSAITAEAGALTTALEAAAADLFVETAVPSDLTADLTTEIAAESTDRGTALTNAEKAQSDFADLVGTLNTAVTAQSDFADLVTTLNEAEGALQASIDEFGSDAQLTADIAQAQLALDNFEAENGNEAALATALGEAEGALAAVPSEAELQTTLTNAQNALAVARADISDEALAQAVTDAQALVDQRTELQGNLTTAEGELQADIDANGTTDVLETALTDAQAALDAAISEGDPELVAQVEALEATLADRADLQGTADSTQAAFELAAETNQRVDALSAAQGVEEAAQEAVDERAELIADVETAQVLADALEALNGDIEAAEATIEELGFELPVTAEDNVFGTAGDDIFLFSGEDATISGFNATGDDKLYIGNGFTRADLESDVDLAATREGDAGTLEIFFQQDGNNAVLSFEEVEFAGNATGSFEGNVITLTGVNVDNLSIDTEGFVTIA